MDNMTKLFQEGGLFTTQGRLGRKRFILSFIAMLISVFVWVLLMFGLFSISTNTFMLVIVFSVLAPVVLFSISIHVRRLHDLNKSGWWYLLIWIIASAGNRMEQFNPLDLISIIILLYLCAKKGTDGENKYGADPVADKQPPAEQ